MKKKDDVIQTADQILQEEILREGKRIEELLGSETYQDPEGVDLKGDFQRLLKEREALKEKTAEYIKAVEGSSEEAVTVYAEPDEDENKYTKNDKKNNRNKKKNSSRKWTGTIAKAAAVVLVVGVCLAGISLQSEATRMWWMESFGWNIGDDSSTKVNNDTERDMSDAPEWEAEAVIEKELGIQVPKFFYKPDRCVFSDYMYETITNRATMYYILNDEYITLSMILSMNNYTSSANFDGIIVSEEIIASPYGDVKIRVIQNAEDKDNAIISEWDYQDVHYEIFGRISFEEMKMMVKNMIL